MMLSSDSVHADIDVGHHDDVRRGSYAMGVREAKPLAKLLRPVLKMACAAPMSGSRAVASRTATRDPL